jgi:hypothetical protein
MSANFLLGKRDLTGPDEIVEFIKDVPEFDPKTEHPDKSGALLLFRTSQQQTWLVATSERLYCVLDDIRKPHPEVRWVMSKDELVANRELILPISARDYSRNSGRVDIGSHKDWLFTKALFSAVSVEDAIAGLIRKQMVGTQTQTFA